MSLLVVGSIALDNLETPVASRKRILGGAGVFFSYAASFFGPVNLVGVVGDDFPLEHIEMLCSRNIDLQGLEIRKGGKTFSWSGKYLENMNDRVTTDVQLNVLGDFSPVLSEENKRASYVFLANGHPATQLSVVEQLNGAELIVADTMDLWINNEREALNKLMQKIDGLVINDSESKMLTGDGNPISAAKKILDCGLKFVIVKKGEHGAMFLSRSEKYVIPAFPTEQIIDPTGAGDTFASGFMAFMAQSAAQDGGTFKKAMAYGTVVASFTVEGFGLDRLREIERRDIEKRFDEFRQIVSF